MFGVGCPESPPVSNVNPSPITVTCPAGFDFEYSSGNCVRTGFDPVPPISPGNAPGSGGGGTSPPPPPPPEPEDCGDARDGLALEYTERGVAGSWPCTVFSRAHSDLIGVGADGYHSSHDGYGYISSALPRGIAVVEAHFNILLKYTSGYRCPVRNAAISSSPNPDGSHHIFGQAVDFYTTTGWTTERKTAIDEWGKTNAVESINYPPEKGNHNHLAWR